MFLNLTHIPFAKNPKKIILSNMLVPIIHKLVSAVKSNLKTLYFVTINKSTHSVVMYYFGHKEITVTKKCMWCPHARAKSFKSRSKVP